MNSSNLKITLTNDDTETSQTILNKNITDGLYLAYLKSTGKYRINTRQNGEWLAERELITNTDLENSNFWFQKTVLPWGNYLNGTYTLEEPFTSKPIRIVCGENGRLSGFWPATQIKDIRSIITPDGIINVKFDSNVQITISGATENWNVRGIYRF